MAELKNLTVRFGDKTVLDRFSLKLPERGLVCLLAPSGSGKTTLLRVLCGLQTPESGTVSGLGTVVLLFQEDRLLPWLTALANLTVAGIPNGEAQRALGAVGLAADAAAYPGELSGGMCRRVALARALWVPSDTLLLDEPFRGLDPARRESIYPLLERAKEKKLVVLVTHDRAEAEALGDCCLDLNGPPLRYHGAETDF